MRGIGRRAAVPAALLAAGLALMHGLALAGNGYQVETASEPISPNSAGGLFASCGQGSKAVGGGFSLVGNASKKITSVFPTAPRKFAVTGRSRSDGNLNLTGYAVCDDDGRFDVVSKSRMVADQEIRTVRAVCPPGSTVAGGGFQLLDDSFELYRSSPAGKRRWAVAAGFFGTGSDSVVAHAVCDLDGGSYTVRSKTKATPPEPRARGVEAIVSLHPQCPDNRQPVSGGHLVEGPGNFEAERSRPKGNGWKLSFDTYAGKSLVFTGYVLCGTG